MQNEQHTLPRQPAHANQVENYTSPIPDLIGGRFPIERPVDLSKRPVLTPTLARSARRKDLAFGPATPRRPSAGST